MSGTSLSSSISILSALAARWMAPPHVGVITPSPALSRSSGRIPNPSAFIVSGLVVGVVEDLPGADLRDLTDRAGHRDRERIGQEARVESREQDRAAAFLAGSVEFGEELVVVFHMRDVGGRRDR